MKIIRNFAAYAITVALLGLLSCNSTHTISKTINSSIKQAKKHYANQIVTIEAADSFINPISFEEGRGIKWGRPGDWRVGFFPGSVWYLYELSGDRNLVSLAEKYTRALEYVQHITDNHDVGFMATDAFGNAFRLTNDTIYKNWMIRTAKSLSTRFRPAAGVIQSWDVDKDWQSKRGWECPVIIDNMMNLELLFDATSYTGDSSFYKIAVSHANKTMENHFRPDGSCFHVIDYGINDGNVRRKQTAQGYSDNSAWARGQAWAIYGFTMCFRYTKDYKYLNQALKTLSFVQNHKNLPEDLIPYWDFDAPKIPNEPRDASSAAVIASALYELQAYLKPKQSAELIQYADKIVTGLASDKYSAPVGANGNFLLMHSVSSLPHNIEIDAALNYADYYFLEALQRRKAMIKNK